MNPINGLFFEPAKISDECFKRGTESITTKDTRTPTTGATSNGAREDLVLASIELLKAYVGFGSIMLATPREPSGETNAAGSN